MNRRDVLALTGASITPLSSGCSALERDTGYTYTLTVSDPMADPSDRVLNFDTAGLTRSQAEIVEASFEAPSRYDGDRYRSAVTVER